MKKKKIIIWTVVAVIAAALLGIGIYFGIQAYKYSQIRFDIKDTLPNGQGKKVTVILLAGQSNASGCSRDDYLQKNVSADQYTQYRNGYDNVYINYYVSGNNISQGFVKCAALQGETGGHFGPELGLAEKLNQLYPDEMFFIIKWAWGGTDLYNMWLSPSSNGTTGQLYTPFVKYVQTSLEYLTYKNYDVTIEGMCWMQGESDSIEDGPIYTSNLWLSLLMYVAGT